jgi:hypothetical protein
MKAHTITTQARVEHIMRRTRIAGATLMVAAGLIGAVAAPATAGKTHTLVGGFNRDPGSSVSMKVELNDKGEPKFVKSFKFSGLDLTCGTSSPQTSVESGLVEVPGKIKIRVKPIVEPGDHRAHVYRKRIEDVVPGEDSSEVVVHGRVTKSGKHYGRVELMLGKRIGACSGMPARGAAAVGKFVASKG